MDQPPPGLSPEVPPGPPDNDFTPLDPFEDASMLDPYLSVNSLLSIPHQSSPHHHPGSSQEIPHHCQHKSIGKLSSAKSNDHAVSLDLKSRGHLDPGAQATTTPHKHLLFGYRRFTAANPCNVRLHAADNRRAYIPLGIGVLRVPAPNQLGYHPILCYHTPEITTTIISPASFETLLGKRNFEGTTLVTHSNDAKFVFTARHKLRRSGDLTITGITHRTLTYTHPLLTPSLAEMDTQSLDATTSTITDELHMHRLSASAERLLWHQRLNHCSDYYLQEAHKYVDGVPKFKPAKEPLHQCPSCLPCKLKRKARGDSTTRTATRSGQGISVDFVFPGQRSKDATRNDDFLGLNGETCYVHLIDHHTGYDWADARLSKGAPVSWLFRLLLRHSSPDMPDKCVCMDQGGELHRNPKIR